MVQDAPYRQAVYTDIEFLRRSVRRNSGIYTALDNKTDRVVADRGIWQGQPKPALSCISRNWNLSYIIVCKAYRKRQHQSRYNKDIICHKRQPQQAEGAQLLEFGDCLCHNNRLWRKCGSRGSYRAHRIGNRQQPRSDVQNGQQDTDAACRLRCGSGDCRRVQGADSRTCVHARSTDDRPYDGVIAADTDIRCNGDMLYIHFLQRRLAVPVPPWRYMDDGTCASIHSSRRVRGHNKPLFHTHDECLWGYLRTVERTPVCPSDAWRHTSKHTDTFLPFTLRRGLQQHKHSAQRQDRGRLGDNPQQLDVCRTWQHAHTLHHNGIVHQSSGNICHQRRRRMWRNVRTVIVHGGIRRISICACMEHARDRCIYTWKELCNAWNGGSNGGSDARSADRYIPYSRDHGRISAIHTVDDCMYMFISHHHNFRAARHIRNASGTRGQTDYASYRPCGTDTDESWQRHRQTLHICTTRYRTWNAYTFYK